MRTIKIVFFLFLLFSIQHSFAQLQESYEKGSVILNSGEQVEGFIKIEEQSKLSTEVCFKRIEADEDCTVYTSAEIKSFQTNSGKYFDLLTLQMDKNKRELRVFANLILKGEASLYKSTYKSNEFFVVRVNSQNYVLQKDLLVSGETEERKYNFRGVLNVATAGYTNSSENIQYTENNFISVLTKYNASKGSESKLVAYKEKKINYILLNIGGGFGKSESEFFIQAMYRTYYPKISRSSSVSIGLNYYKYHYSELYNERSYQFTKTLTTIPVQVQQNIFNKRIRPYVFGGLNLSYLKIVDSERNSLLKDRLQNNFGIGLLYGAGIEMDIYKGLMLKSEYRNEIFQHLFLFGIGYNFSK